MTSPLSPTPGESAPQPHTCHGFAEAKPQSKDLPAFLSHHFPYYAAGAAITLCLPGVTIPYTKEMFGQLAKIASWPNIFTV